MRNKKVLVSVLMAVMLFCGSCDIENMNGGNTEDQVKPHKIIREEPKLNYTSSDYVGGYDEFMIVNEKQDNYLYITGLNGEQESLSEKEKYEGPDMYYHLEVQKGWNKDEVINSFQYVKLTEKGAEELLANGPCNAFVTFNTDKECITQVVFYTEVQVGKKVDYACFFKDKALNQKEDIIGNHWYEKDSCISLMFSEDGSWGYGDGEEPVGASDMYPSYEYNEDEGIITVYSENKDRSSKITVVEHTKDKLVVKMEEELAGGTHTFIAETDYLGEPTVPLREGDYPVMEGLFKIVDIDTNRVEIDAVSEEYKEISEKIELSDDANFFIMEEVEGDIDRKSDLKYRYIQITNKGAQRLLKESSCSAFVAGDDNGKISKIVFYPLGKADK